MAGVVRPNAWTLCQDLINRYGNHQGQVNDYNVAGGNYEHGHLIAFRNWHFTQHSANQTMIVPNMVLQWGDMNGGYWRGLEQYVIETIIPTDTPLGVHVNTEALNIEE